MTKRYAPDAGGVRKIAGADPMTAGKATPTPAGRTVKAALANLKAAIDRMPPNVALMTGVPRTELPEGRKAWDIVTADDPRLDPAACIIARSKDYFGPVEGPAFFPLDFDVKEWPAEIKARLAAAGGLDAVMRAVCPGLGEAGRLISPSASAHIVNPATGKGTGDAGQHWYYVLTDGRDTVALAERIAARLEAAGWAWCNVSKAGTILHKTLIDTAASDPTRIWYEAAPVLEGGLAATPAKVTRLVEGRALRLDDVHELTAAEEATRQANRAQARGGREDEAAVVKTAHEAELVARRVARGEDPEAAAQAVKAAAGGALIGDFEIAFDDGTTATVREMLDDPAAFNGKTLPDPMEPDYRGGRNVAVAQMSAPARIWSQAHGGTAYQLFRDEAERARAERGPRPEDYFEVVATEGTGDRTSRFFPASDLAGRPVPPREWLVVDLVPQGTVTLFGGDGGTGKSLLALQLATAVAAKTDWIGKAVTPGRAIYISAEDEEAELHRRLADILRATGRTFEDVANLTLRSLAGEDALLATESNLRLVETTLYRELDARAEADRPRLIVIDTLADVYPANENDRAKVRQFVGMLRHLALKHSCAVILLAHPSLSGLNSGSGMSGSTAWNNSVRSRLYLSRVTVDGHEPDPDKRILSTKKANYGRVGEEVSLRWQRGAFEAAHQVVVTEGETDGTPKAERVFLKLLRAFAEQGRKVNAGGGATYAPNVFAKHPDSDGVTKAAFRGAMDALLSQRLIRVAEDGPPSKRRQFLEVSE